MTGIGRLQIAVTLLMVVAANPAASEQALKPADVSRFLGIWTGDIKANEKAFSQGLLPAEHGLKILTANDSLVVTTTFRRPPIAADTPWLESDKLSYKLGGAISSDSMNHATATKLAMDGDALVLTVVQTPGGRGAAPPSPETVLQTMKMSVNGDRLRLEWSSGRFTSTLFYDRQKQIGSQEGGPTAAQRRVAVDERQARRRAPSRATSPGRAARS
jgi:hypothetical protein